MTERSNHMVYQATKQIAKAFKDAGLKCGIQEVANFSFVEAGFTGKNCTFKLRFISVDDDNDVKAMTEDFAKYPESKFQNGYKMMNELSRTYKYFKFTMDDNGAVCAQYDFPVSLTSDAVGQVAVEIALRCMKIIDDAYPNIMKSIWQ